MTKRSSKASEATHQYLFGVLERGKSQRDPELWRVMKEIHDYLTSSFYLELNPLAGLLSILPQFQWRFSEIRSPKALEQEVSSADFIWRMNWWLARNNAYKVITASRWEQDIPKRMFFIDENDGSMTAIGHIKKMEFVDNLGCIAISRSCLPI